MSGTESKNSWMKLLHQLFVLAAIVVVLIGGYISANKIHWESADFVLVALAFIVLGIGFRGIHDGQNSQSQSALPKS